MLNSIVSIATYGVSGVGVCNEWLLLTALYAHTNTTVSTLPSLTDPSDPPQELKRKFKIMNHQIEQLKEEISSKDLALVKEHFDHMKVEKEKESLRFELNKARQQLKEADSAITAQRV